ncbi:hypothetical protein RvVAT039_25730 [Agrobacterium vitis]|nr:hypothetical protein RvVAT039_25730 [Agrobacterium vitis]
MFAVPSAGASTGASSTQTSTSSTSSTEDTDSATASSSTDSSDDSDTDMSDEDLLAQLKNYDGNLSYFADQFINQLDLPGGGAA